MNNTGIKKMNNRKKIMWNLIFSVGIILLIICLSYMLSDSAIKSNVKTKNLAPSFSHLFGTDWLGRDMFTRAVKGMYLSLSIAVVTCSISLVIALVLGAMSAMGNRVVRQGISWVVDLFMSMPHLVFMILLAFLFKGGKSGLIISMAVTHWPTLARIVRSEILQLRSENYILISKKMGKSKYYIFKNHYLPHLFSILLVAFILMCPHIILHEAFLTFLGFGLSPQTPAIGIILSEGMGNISTGNWWLLVFPGILLVVISKLFDNVGDKLGVILDPTRAQE